MGTNTTTRLRLLVAGGGQERFDQVTRTVASLGHEVVGASDLTGVTSLTVSVAPDVAIVVVSEGSERALKLIRTIVKEATCPVIAILDVQDPAFVKEAAKLGIFAYITDGEDPGEFQSSIDIALRRFAEYHDLEGAFGRRAVTERAKGILMERHSMGEEEAFNLLREQARRTNSKIVDVAAAVVGSHRLLPASGGLPAGAGTESSPSETGPP
jgi:AmiR/NasT family two-component response regulator